jgi:hypothetical protein
MLKIMKDNIPAPPEPTAADPQPLPKSPWRHPEVTLLDVEQGTVATTGNFCDGHNGSTS